MRALIQRVTQAQVSVAGKSVGAIESGLLLFLGIEKEDDQAKADRLLEKVLAYRVFSDQQGRMNQSVIDVEGGLLLVSQFTLAADTGKGLRPSFSSAAPPQEAEGLYNYFLAQMKARHSPTEAGIFGADMQVQLTNDGPVTFLLEA